MKHTSDVSEKKIIPPIDLLTRAGIIRAGMTRAEHTPSKEGWQDTANKPVGQNQTLPDTHTHRESLHDKRESTLYPSDLSEDILENPALYVGPADF